MARRTITREQPHNRMSIAVLVLLLGMVSALSVVVRTYAMPAEARTTETWYTYRTVVSINYVANVQKGKYYPRAQMLPDELARVRLPVEPPVYRRALISRYTDSIAVKVSYEYTGDRPAPGTKVRLRIDGILTVPNVWQMPYPLVAEKELPMTGESISGEETFLIPVSQFLADMEAARLNNLGFDPMEFFIRPVFEVDAGGLKHPVHVALNPEYKVTIRNNTVELDEPKDDKAEKEFSETRVLPLTLPIMGFNLRVDHLRQISLYSLVVIICLAVTLALLRRTKPDNRTLLQKLGPNLLSVKSFEIPGDSAIADVRSAKELLQLHSQTERPVIKVASTYYLLDGSTCYRLVLSETEAGGTD